MKIQELKEDRYVNMWAKSLAAKNKAAEKKAKDKRKEIEAIDKAIKDANKKIADSKKQTSEQIWYKVMYAFGNSFPDGDPIDELGTYMRKYNVSMEQVDRAVRKHNRGVKGYYDYLAQSWDDFADDQIHDAENGHSLNTHSPFYTVVDAKSKPVKVQKAQNPWK